MNDQRKTMETTRAHRQTTENYEKTNGIYEKPLKNKIEQPANPAHMES